MKKTEQKSWNWSWEHKNKIEDEHYRGRNTLSVQYWTTWVSQLSCSCHSSFSFYPPSEFLSLYSLFGKGHCWHWVQEGSLRVPLPSRNCRTRSTSRARTKSATRTWAMINLNCKKVNRKKCYFKEIKPTTTKKLSNVCLPQLEYLQEQTVRWIPVKNQ